MKSTLENEFLKIDVDAHGAEFSSITEKSTGHHYLWQGDPAYWPYRSPLLFPIVGNLNNGVYIFEGKEYHLGLHGFAKTMDFEMENKSSDFLSLSVCENSSTLQRYPFKFRLNVGYALRGRTLIVSYRVDNTGEKRMWFSIGAHPAFNCSMSPGGRKNASLVFDKRETVSRLVNESGYLTGAEEPFLTNQDTIELSSIDFDGKRKVSIMQGLESDTVSLLDGVTGRQVRVGFSGFPYLGIWSPSNAAPFVCIEPWYGITSTAGETDELTQKKGIQSLDPASSFECSYAIQFQ